ncbi:IS701 family transposase [Kitasatospora sp. NPDC052896]|uniref:IS701 family transposase n=1 Tax=Kitasatospora sp. NPDC052896 TaxID=3364061 RepID=UPI0037C55ABB
MPQPPTGTRRWRPRRSNLTVIQLQAPGRIENSQIGVFLAYASDRGRALIDRRLYLPERTWCADDERRSLAGVPDAVGFATKARLALEMIAAALDAGLSTSWVTGDEVYGQDPDLRAGLEARGIGYVLAAARTTLVRINQDRTPVTVEKAVDCLPATACHRQSAGAGAKGPRYYDWAWVEVGADCHHHLLVRRNTATGELAFYLCWSPQQAPLSDLVRVAGIRWCIEECFQAAKGQVGLDQYQVRHWTSWHRHITLAMLALAFLASLAANARPNIPAEANRAARSTEPIDLTVPEIRHLIAGLFPAPAASPATLLNWSNWRRTHQATARRSHYRRRLAEPPAT